MNANLACNLVAAAGRDGAHPALRLDGVEVSYGRLDEVSARAAGLLADAGVSPGDRVAIMLPNVPAFAACYYGVLRCGATVVALNIALGEPEVAFCLRDSEARVLFAWRDFEATARAGARQAGTRCVVVAAGDFEALVDEQEPLEGVASRSDADTAVILFASQETGTRKGSELTHARLRRDVEIALGLLGLGPDAVTLGALPLFDCAGQACALNATVAVGGTLTLIPRFDPGRALEIIERDRVSVFAGAPAMYAALLAHRGRERFDVSSLRRCASGGLTLPRELARAFEEAFGCTILEAPCTEPADAA
jgi:long-chain acyl-CoA synthetase